MRRQFILAGCLALLLIAPSRAGAEQEQASSPAALRPSGQLSLTYKIGPKDELHITVAGMPELETRATVNELGTIRMPLLGEINAIGVTTRDYEDILEAALARFVTNPEVTVEVTQYQSSSYFLYGAVGGQGSYNITGRTTLLEALVRAGGLSEDEAAGPIRIIRRSFLLEPLEVDGRELFFKGNIAYDIDIEPGDMINVVRKLAYRIYIYQDGGRGGAYTFRDPVTLLQAVALIGGIGEGASDKVRIVRKHPDGRTEEIEADIGDIMERKVEDVQLQAEDVILIKRGGFFD